jgi:hypothetical protein
VHVLEERRLAAQTLPTGTLFQTMTCVASPISIETIIYYEIKCVGLYGRNTIDLPLSDYRIKTHKSGTLIGEYVNAANHIRRKIIMCTPGPTSTNLVKFICYNYDPVGTLLKQGNLEWYTR